MQLFATGDVFFVMGVTGGLVIAGLVILGVIGGVIVILTLQLAFQFVGSSLYVLDKRVDASLQFSLLLYQRVDLSLQFGLVLC
jgi:hypothetical protein